jgi:hypothetical protein
MTGSRRYMQPFAQDILYMGRTVAYAHGLAVESGGRLLLVRGWQDKTSESSVRTVIARVKVRDHQSCSKASLYVSISLLTTSPNNPQRSPLNFLG